MNVPLNDSIKLTDPEDILAAVPHLLGFTPTESLIVISIDNAGTPPRFGTTLRLDLPPREQHWAVAEYLSTGPLRHQQADAVLLNIIGQEARSDLDRSPPHPASQDSVALPHQDLVSVLREVLGNSGITVLHASWAPEISAGAPWRCYDDDACGGEITDPKSSPLAAALAAAGAVTFESRQELQDLVAADPPDVLARRTAKLDALTEDLERDAAPEVARRDIGIVFDAVQRTAEDTALTEDDCLRLLLALSDHRVRDLALGMALGEWAQPAERLWLTLVRQAPPPEVADVAALLAFSAYLRGEGALASVALERIEAVRPEHRLGSLLRQALDTGIAPAELAVIVRDASDDARILIEEEGDWS